jgi:hypothetical protein
MTMPATFRPPLWAWLARKTPLWSMAGEFICKVKRASAPR